VSGLYERAKFQGKVRHRHFIIANGRRVAIHASQSGSFSTLLVVMSARGPVPQ
jgi:hypothetical protein